MGTRTIRRTSVVLPCPLAPDRYLPRVTSLSDGHGHLAAFRYTAADLRELHLLDTDLQDGRISGLRTERTRLEKLRIDSVQFSGCDLASLRWSDSRLSRTVFRDCTLVGAALDDLTLDNVLFENCTLDYSVLTRIRCTGPVIFSACSLRETVFATADARTALLDGCTLWLTEFDGGTYRGLDLRGNDLSRIRGLFHLQQIVIDRTQTTQLAEALAVELEVGFGDGGGGWRG
ncbi:pentapeptide repeat-containing protein [Streptomyces sp. 796.1]|uniref:pentapeptide repeat-containing protein n=1 Tax=Streptomyces sp. 796.1 TaxID=3163029 RepID=UPI0039C91ABA